MTTAMRVEAELPLSRITFPPILDHAWGFSTSAIHARPMTLNTDGTVSENLAQMKEIDNGEFQIQAFGDLTWTDGHAVEFEELARTIVRGLRIVPQIGSAIDISKRTLVIKSTLPASTLKRVMASLVFSMTPCVRDETSRATSGTFALVDIREQGRAIVIAKRNQRRDQSEIILIATPSARIGDDLFRSDQLEVTRVLGGYRPANKVDDSPPVDYVMGLRGHPRSYHALAFSALLNQMALSEASGGTYQPWTDIRCLGARKPLPSEICLTYANFYPNHEIAVEIARQITAANVLCRFRAVPYTEYLTKEVVPGELRLEIVDLLFGHDDSFVPLLRGRATSRVREGLPVPVDFINARAEYDWDALLIRR